MLVRAKRSVQNGVTYENLQTVESFRDQGKPRQRVIATLGRSGAPAIAGHSLGLMEVPAGESEPWCQAPFVSS